MFGDIIKVKMVVFSLKLVVVLLLSYRRPPVFLATVVLRQEVLAKNGVDVDKAALRTFHVRKAVLRKKLAVLPRTTDNARPFYRLHPIDHPSLRINAAPGRFSD